MVVRVLTPSPASCSQLSLVSLQKQICVLLCHPIQLLFQTVEPICFFKFIPFIGRGGFTCYFESSDYELV
ncbi:hypothetical protein RJT34_25047 [Clitoria ternatea]|uniref:Uncharacterized protein n=1 Tax=Clitoria ternatea TaxID=43366 RepID=A0AAN9IJQ1_CLITE